MLDGDAAAVPAIRNALLQELLGFNQASAYLGFINGRHPRGWLMNT